MRGVRDGVLLAGAAALLLLSVAVDFASAILSIASDGLFVLGGAALVAVAFRHKDRQVKELRAERDALLRLGGKGGG